MPPPSRSLLPARRPAPDWLEIALYALLLAIGVVMALPGPLSEAEERPDQCGNIQSSADVIAR